MIGDTVTIDGVEYEIVWAGGEGLTADRETKPGDTWTPPPRLYNKTGKYSKKKLKEAEICQTCGGFVHKCEKFGHINEEPIDGQ